LIPRIADKLVRAITSNAFRLLNYLEILFGRPWRTPKPLSRAAELRVWN